MAVAVWPSTSVGKSQSKELWYRCRYRVQGKWSQNTAAVTTSGPGTGTGTGTGTERRKIRC